LQQRFVRQEFAAFLHGDPEHFAVPGAPIGDAPVDGAESIGNILHAGARSRRMPIQSLVFAIARRSTQSGSPISGGGAGSIAYCTAFPGLSSEMGMKIVE
jgi:hypothetical protein